MAITTSIAAATDDLLPLMPRRRTGTKNLAGICTKILAGLLAVCAALWAVDPDMALLINAFRGAGIKHRHLLLQIPISSTKQ